MNDHSENTRRSAAKEALLEVACRLFSERGYEAVSTRELSEAAGVNLAAIQYHFGSKEKLFLETVRQLMGSAGCQRATTALQGFPENEFEAGTMLCAYIKAALEDLADCSGPQPCRVMFREILNQSAESASIHKALVHFVVEDFVRPLDQVMINVLRQLAPEKTLEELEWCAQSIAGQLAFYITHRPFYEQLRGRNLADSKLIIAAARHIAGFSLRGLGLNSVLIHKIIENSFVTKVSRESKAA